MKTAGAFLLGVFLILVITPLAQFSTIALTNHDMETAAASGWVFGLLVSMVLALAAFRALAKRPAVGRQGMVIVFCMLSIAVPIMNLGFARLMLLSLVSVQDHFIFEGVDTYRRAYLEQDPDWFPITPTRSGLARAKSEQKMRLLADAKVEASRRVAYQDLSRALESAGRRLRQGREPASDLRNVWSTELPKLGIRQVERLRRELPKRPQVQELLAEAGALEELERRFTELRTGSENAAERLSASTLDERRLYFIPSVRTDQLDQATRIRMKKLEERLGPDASDALLSWGRGTGEQELLDLRRDASLLGGRDEEVVLDQWTADLLARWESLSEEELAAIRTEFLFRLRTTDRKAIFGRGPEGDREGHDLASFKESVFKNAVDQRNFQEQGFGEKVTTVRGRVAWNLWKGPLLRWSAVALTIFLFLFCLAEWLRRKWVERENLAFPLVDIADNLIRHDYKLETAEDLLHPEKRKGPFAGTFWAGFAIGAIMLLAEAIIYYGGGEGGAVGMDINKKLFTSGTIQQFDDFFLVLSPILLGLFFLVSLEISYSVWSVFLIFRIVFFAIGQGAQGGIRDAEYLGWAMRSFPFEKEQMLGAGLAMGILMVVKAWGAGRGREVENMEKNRSMPTWLMITGLVLMPILLYALFRDLGMEQPVMFLLFGSVFVLMAITAARLRAETGLPMQHVGPEVTRLPLMLGMSRLMSVKSMVNFMPLVVLPMTLLSRMLPVQLENMELARRHQMKGRTVAIAGVIAFVIALGWGLVSLLVMSHWLGDEVLGTGTNQGVVATSLVAYPMWVFHFLGEQGLGSFDDVHRTRLWFVSLGASVFILLTLMRKKVLKKFLGLPPHPLGYLLFLFSIHSMWLSPYHKGTGDLKLDGASWLWGSALIAWLIKKLVIKYGGMNTYRAAKPAAVGLIAGALFTLFMVNTVDLLVSSRAERPGHDPSDFEKTFIEIPSYTPQLY